MRSGSNANGSRPLRFGERSCRSSTRRPYHRAVWGSGVSTGRFRRMHGRPSILKSAPQAAPISSGRGCEPLRIRGDLLLRAAEVLRRVDGQPEPLVPEGAEAAFGDELRERRRLVVAPLGEPLERLLAEDVDAGVDPVGNSARLPEARDDVVGAQVDQAERRRRPGDRDRRRSAAALVACAESDEVDVEELVPVQREHVAGLPPRARGETDPAAAPEPLGLLRGDDLRAEAFELADEEVALTGRAADDHAGDSGSGEPRDLVADERLPAAGPERLRTPPRPLRQEP